VAAVVHPSRRSGVRRRRERWVAAGTGVVTGGGSPLTCFQKKHQR